MELADIGDLKSPDRDIVRVRVPHRPPTEFLPPFINNEQT